MSILIRNMGMPKNCPECPCEHYECMLLNKDAEDIMQYFTGDKRHPECPLIELPPHGRLIDVDELVADIKGQAERLWTLDAVSESDYFIERNEKFRQAMLKTWCDSLFAYLSTRPTVIEADV